MASNDEQRSATTILTTAAQSIAARLIANETTAKFTKAEISTTNLFNQSVTELQVLTSLDNVQQTADINTVTVINNNTVNVNVAIDQTKAPNNYQMNSVGLFAVDGDGKEVLYSVTVLKDPVYIHQDAMGSALGIDLETVVGQASNVEISVNPAGAVTNEILKATLADYVKTDDVKSLIPATVIDGSKPADFKESVTLEKGAVDGAGIAIATAKDLADGDAETLTSAKEYADTQAGDKVKTADTVNWQKAKISADDGSPKSFLYAKDGGNITMWIAGRPLGIHTFWCAAGVTGNPVSSSIQGTMSISSVKNGVGYCVSADGDFISITLVDGQVNYDILTKKSDIDPSVIVKTTLTASDDVLNLDYGSYTISGPLPKNAPDLENTGINWGTLVVLKTLSGANKTLEYRDVKGNVLINILSGKPLTWSGWHIPNENSVVKDNGDDTVTINRKTYVPANAANVVDRNPDTGTVSEPVDFTKLTVNGGKSVATSDDLKSLEASAWMSLGNPTGQCVYNDGSVESGTVMGSPLMMKYDESTGTTQLSGGFMIKFSKEYGTWTGTILTLPNGFKVTSLKDFITALLTPSWDSMGTLLSYYQDGMNINASLIRSGTPAGFQSGISFTGMTASTYRQFMTNKTTTLLTKI